MTRRHWCTWICIDLEKITRCHKPLTVEKTATLFLTSLSCQRSRQEVRMWPAKSTGSEGVTGGADRKWECDWQSQQEVRMWPAKSTGSEGVTGGADRKWECDWQSRQEVRVWLAEPTGSESVNSGVYRKWECVRWSWQQTIVGNETQWPAVSQNRGNLILAINIYKKSDVILCSWHCVSFMRFSGGVESAESVLRCWNDLSAYCCNSCDAIRKWR